MIPYALCVIFGVLYVIWLASISTLIKRGKRDDTLERSPDTRCTRSCANCVAAAVLRDERKARKGKGE